MTSTTAPVAVITGASRGIGRAIALTQAAKGYNIVGTWVRDESAASSLRDEIAASGRRCVMHQVDLADPEQAAALVDAVSAEFGTVDALVHSAGIASRGRHVADTTSDEVNRVVSVHALGAFYLCSGLAPLLRGSGNGRIVLVSSIATSNPVAGSAPYMMGKAALEALGQTLALEEAPHGTRVNIVAPGLVSTIMGDRLARAVTGVGSATDLDSSMPFGRVTRPEDVAEVVAFLLSDGARQITGQRIEIHGGKPGISL
jgi:3-oxoacyl-[acyl-carrier protein] reductase